MSGGQYNYDLEDVCDSIDALRKTLNNLVWLVGAALVLGYCQPTCNSRQSATIKINGPDAKDASLVGAVQ